MSNTNTSTTSLHNFGQMNSSSITAQPTIDLNTHKKRGFFFSKKLSSNDLIKWSKDPIQKPLIRVNDKLVKKEAPELFKHILLEPKKSVYDISFLIGFFLNIYFH
jgi:hypothetical protein